MQALSDQSIEVLQGVLDDQGVAKVCQVPILPMCLCFVHMNEELCIRSRFFMETKAEQTFGTEHGARETLQT